MNIKGFVNKPIIEFMKSMKLNTKLIDILLYVIGCLPTNQETEENKILTRDYVFRLSTYLRSIGQYGPTPMLVPIYSSSEFPQAFARTSCVMNSVFIVNKLFTIDKLTFVDDIFKNIGISFDPTPIQGDNLIYGSEYAQIILSKTSKSASFKYSNKFILQMVSILSRPIIGSPDKPLCISVIPPNHPDLKNSQPVRIFQRRTDSRTSGLIFYIVYVTLSSCEKDEENSKEVLHKMLKLFEILSPVPKVPIKSADKSETESKQETSTEATPPPIKNAPEMPVAIEESKMKTVEKNNDLVKYYTIFKIKQIEDPPRKLGNATFCPMVNQDIDTDNAFVFFH